MGGMRGSSHKRVPIALKLPQLQVRLPVFTTHFVDDTDTWHGSTSNTVVQNVLYQEKHRGMLNHP